MIGHNAPHHIHSRDDALGVAAVIAGLRAAIETAEAEYKPQLDFLKEQADTCRAERDAIIKPYAERMESLRKMLADYLADDPDGNLKDGDRIVATLQRRKPHPDIDPAKVPDRFKSLTVDMAKVNAALVRDEDIPGVTWKTKTVLVVL